MIDVTWAVKAELFDVVAVANIAVKENIDNGLLTADSLAMDMDNTFWQLSHSNPTCLVKELASSMLL